MALADYTPARATVEFTGGSFQVRGLSLDDVSILMRSHLPDVEALVGMLSESNGGGNIEVGQVMQHAITLVKEAPGLVANLIALAADEPDLVDKARALALPIQVRAIETICNLTFDEAGGPKKFFESLVHLLSSLRPAP